MFPDFKELLSAFNAAHVKYLVVGGYAVSFHANPRATKDLDILISADPENAKAVHAALAQFGAPLEKLTARDFAEEGSFFRMGAPPVMVDIFPSIGGVDFESAWQRRVSVTVDGEFTAPFISREDLLAAKLSAGRPQDLADVAALCEAKEADAPTHDHSLSGSSAEEIRRRGREEWLKLRKARGAALTPEETRSKGRDAWLKMRHEPAKRAACKQTPTKDARHPPERKIDEDL